MIMGPKDVIRGTLDAGEHVLKSYLNDLSDADLRLRPIEGMHSIAMQLGHLIVVERRINNLVRPGSAPALPEGFAAAHDFENPPGDDSGLRTKDEYLSLFDSGRAATRATLDRLTDAELDGRHGGPLPDFAPTVGAALNLCGAHPLLHAGQFVAVRRTLNKPIAF